MFLCLHAPALPLSRTKFVSETEKKMFPISFADILYPQQTSPRLLAQENITSNNVSATMCPRLSLPLEVRDNTKLSCFKALLSERVRNPESAMIRRAGIRK